MLLMIMYTINLFTVACLENLVVYNGVAFIVFLNKWVLLLCDTVIDS